jgi:hypothetical protein
VSRKCSEDSGDCARFARHHHTRPDIHLTSTGKAIHVRRVEKITEVEDELHVFLLCEGCPELMNRREAFLAETRISSIDPPLCFLHLPHDAQEHQMLTNWGRLHYVLNMNMIF